MFPNKTKLYFIFLIAVLYPQALLAQNAGSWIETDPVLTFPAVSVADNAFVPYWSGQLETGYFSEGGGQQGSGFFLDGTKRLTREGSFFTFGVQGGTQQLENSLSAWGGLVFGAGVGLGGWTPFFVFSAQKGDMTFNAMTVNVGGNIPLASGFTSQLFVTGITASHTGPFASLLGLSDSSAEVDELNADIGFNLKLKVDSMLALISGFQEDLNQTVKFQNLSHTVSLTPNLSDNLDIFKLGFDLNFSNSWAVEITGKGGWDLMPAGSFYSDRLAQTITLSNASTVFFVGGTADLRYQF
ncbi:MAG TPA: hypothetical protein VK791_03815 [bacterium]|jgi:hypothetical protein|nr:hypothetical protein [bacterium]